MNKVICVYSSSSCTIDPRLFELAEALGRGIAARGATLIFGGGLIGLMGATARGVHGSGGQVIGVIPEALNVPGVVYETCDELIVTKDLRERKGIMDARSDAFVALPGGYGTLEELLEIITLKQLRYHNKPVVILNALGFYEKLLEQFEAIIAGNFAKAECKKLYHVADTVDEVFHYLDHYQPHQFGAKWLTDVPPECEK